ncbi:MAG: hypothetical protein CL608_30085 [Anaerolineaceae bacterium]|nr:hypothetical protein [Anaerolineaceae bacterium]
MNHILDNLHADIFWGNEVNVPFVLERIIEKVAWMLDTTRLLAEAACTAAALAFYMYEATYVNLPYYLSCLPFLVYLGQGIFLVSRSERRLEEGAERKRVWWRLVIAVLGWPIHYGMVDSHQCILGLDKWHAPEKVTIDWLKEKLVSSLLVGIGIWFFGYVITATIVAVVAQHLGLS